MKQYMPVQIAVANCSGSVEADEIYSFIENNLEDVQTYSFDPDKVRDLRAKGHIIGAAIDYVVLLTNLAYITTIYKAAEILYAAYRKFIPKDGYAGLYMHLPDGTQFMLRQGDDNKDDFIQEFTTKIVSINKQRDAFEKQITEIKTNFENDPLWMRRK